MEKSASTVNSYLKAHFSQVVELLLLVNWDEDPVHLLEKEEAANQALVAAAHAGHKQVQVNIFTRGAYTG